VPEFLDEFFRDYFINNGWEPLESESIQQTIDFKNEKFRLNITLTGMIGAYNLSMHCEKLNTGQHQPK
jgi:hypothetical protein